MFAWSAQDKNVRMMQWEEYYGRAELNDNYVQNIKVKIISNGLSFKTISLIFPINIMKGLELRC